ncbi:MAG: FAD:protein FMN transferase [Acidobacteria bacterium]|nr:FAD:protein FMN transferase [Acidobacteriota bacterium]
MLKRREFLKAVPSPPATDDGYWLHVHRTAMACRFEVTLPMAEQAGVQVATNALEDVAQIEQQLTIFQESSEVSFVNQFAGARPVRIAPSLFALLAQCQALHQETVGAFDITAGPLSQCWGFVRRQGRLPEAREIEAALALVGGDKLILQSEITTIQFARAGVTINLGSIGKGYALDQVAAKMRNQVQTALLSAGSSSLLAIGQGSHEQRGWSVGIRHPRHPNQRLAVLRLRNVAMATSGSEEQYFEHEGKRYGHIIDPRTGWPADQVAGVTVIAPSAALADALATAFYVGGRTLAESYCATHPNVLVLMLEREAEQPILIGTNPHCEVEIIHE